VNKHTQIGLILCLLALFGISTVNNYYISSLQEQVEEQKIEMTKGDQVNFDFIVDKTHEIQDSCEEQIQILRLEIEQLQIVTGVR
jgi:TolA-binding protein